MNTVNPVVENTMKIKTPMEQVDDLKYWLATAPVNWEADQNIRRYLLPTGEYISCVLWNSLYHITGTDIVRSLVFRFHAFGRPVKNIKKFEEGVFSDLRNLKPGMDASLEEPKSEFLEMLYKNNCIRTQKKQKVFYWFSVPHDRLFLDALERDLKREKMGIEPTTIAEAEPALSFSFDSTQSLYDQFTKGMSPSSSEPSSPQLHSLVYDTVPPMAPIGPAIKTDDPSAVLYSLDQESLGNPTSAQPSLGTFALFQPIEHPLVKPQIYPSPDLSYCSMEEFQKGPYEASSPPEYFVPGGSPWSTSTLEDPYMDNSRHSSPDNLDNVSNYSQQAIVPSSTTTTYGNSNTAATAANLFGMFSIFEGAPTYKQRRRRANSCTNVNVNNSNSPPHRSNAAPYSLKTYTCPLPICGRLFKRLEHLKRHVRTHTMERPYSCQVCGKRFSRSDNLAQHRKTHERSLGNSPPPSDDGCTSDLGYDEGMVNDCYPYDSPDLQSTCVPDGLAVYTTEPSNYPIFSLPYLEGSAGNGIIV